MSWLTPVIREVMADKAATDHKLQFFENGATPNLIVKFDLDSVEKMRPFIELFKEGHEGSANAYKTLFLGAGTDATPVGSDFRQMDFKVTQGAGETRIAAAAGVPPVIVGLSEGLQAATYSNYSQARRRFADGTMRPLWRNLCGSLERVLNVPGGAHLWYDDRDIPALKEDIQDKAKEMQENATAANQLVIGWLHARIDHRCDRLGGLLAACSLIVAEAARASRCRRRHGHEAQRQNAGNRLEETKRCQTPPTRWASACPDSRRESHWSGRSSLAASNCVTRPTAVCRR
jgi:hypothetical protein